jgi:LmbE family N-acetylglucosaminyl deacetylase
MLAFSVSKAKNILLLGAHADDIEIGCGGTVLKLLSEHKDLHVFWVVFSAEGKRRGEARSSARKFLQGASHSKIAVKQFENRFFPSQRGEIKRYFEILKHSFVPDIVFTHYREDRHQDHRVLSDLSWNTFRNHLILEYEIPKYDGDMGIPNLFVPLKKALSCKKVNYLSEFFETQKSKHWFSEDTFLALMRLRGVECASKYAEAFYCRKMVCG